MDSEAPNMGLWNRKPGVVVKTKRSGPSPEQAIQRFIRSRFLGLVFFVMFTVFIMRTYINDSDPKIALGGFAVVLVVMSICYAAYQRSTARFYYDYRYVPFEPPSVARLKNNFDDIHHDELLWEGYEVQSASKDGVLYRR